MPLISWSWLNTGRRDLMLKTAIVLVSAVIFAAGGWYAYYQGTPVAQSSSAPTLVKADMTPTKFRPDDPGGLQVPHQDKLIFTHLLASQPKNWEEHLLPPLEATVQRPNPMPKIAAPRVSHDRFEDY